MILPLVCQCGSIVAFSNENRCEECWTTDQARLGVGKPTRVQVAYRSQQQIEQGEKRLAEIKAIFERAAHERHVAAKAR